MADSGCCFVASSPACFFFIDPTAVCLFAIHFDATNWSQESIFCLQHLLNLLYSYRVTVCHLNKSLLMMNTAIIPIVKTTINLKLKNWLKFSGERNGARFIEVHGIKGHGRERFYCIGYIWDDGTRWRFRNENDENRTSFLDVFWAYLSSQCR